MFIYLTNLTMKKILLYCGIIVFLTLFITSCSAELYYQVCQLDAENSLKHMNTDNEDSPYVGTNNDCAVSYNFWDKGGNVGFDMKNLTDRNLYVYLPECFVISNGKAYDYYDNIKFRDPKIICIPPRASKSIGCPYKMNLFVDCNFEMFPKKQSDKLKFSETTSPYIIENCITYSYNSDCKELKHLTHKFWVSQITNYSYKSYIKSVDMVDCLHGKAFVESSRKTDVYIYTSPRAFYNLYLDKDLHLWNVESEVKDKEKFNSDYLEQ